MPQQTGSNSGLSDEAMSDVVGQITARVLAAMREENGAAPPAEPEPPARRTTAELLEEARPPVSGVVEAVRQQASSRLDKQKEHAVAELSDVAGTVRQMGEQLKQPEHGAVAQYAAQYGEAAADGLEQLSTYLRAHDVKQLVREVENFARREPVLFTGGAFLLGLLGARFLKSKPVSPAETVPMPLFVSPVEEPPRSIPTAPMPESVESDAADFDLEMDDSLSGDASLAASEAFGTSDDAPELSTNTAIVLADANGDANGHAGTTPTIGL